MTYVTLFNTSTLTDTTSLVCGDATGLTYCGNREILIWDNTLNKVHNLTGSTLFTLHENSLIIATNLQSNVGEHSFKLFV